MLSKRYPPEQRERAIIMLQGHRDEYPSEPTAIKVFPSGAVRAKWKLKSTDSDAKLTSRLIRCVSPVASKFSPCPSRILKTPMNRWFAPSDTLVAVWKPCWLIIRKPRC